jgi:hypothetical protein
VSDVLAKVVCSKHPRAMGLLRRRPNGVQQFSTLNVGLYARHKRALGSAARTSWNFFEVSDYERDVEAWCPDCGSEGRRVPGAELLAAAEGRRSKRIVI